MNRKDFAFSNGFARTFLFWGFTFFVGIVAGWFLESRLVKNTIPSSLPVRESAEKYSFIHPLLSTGDIPQLRSFDDLSHNIGADIERFVAEGKLSSASVYFRDLETGRWMGINEDEKYAPASLLKVALMMTYLKGAESDPNLLSRETVFKKEYLTNEQDGDNFPRMEVGSSYTIADLIRRMIVYSDNDAKNTLQAILDTESRQRIFSDFGVTLPQLSDRGDSMSPKAYSIFFRVLYNSSYLSRPLSEGALKLLSEVQFKDALSAGIPESVPVSHKFGSRIFTDKDKPSRELHDCGIVYYPDHPYFICVMTKGSDVADLENVIKDISLITYKFIEKTYPVKSAN